MNVAPSSSSVLYPIDTVDDILAPLTPLGVHIVAVFAFLVGGTMLLFGQRFLKLCVFCTGFGVGFLLFACAADKLNETVSALGFAPHTILLIALVGGSLFGTLSVRSDPFVFVLVLRTILTDFFSPSFTFTFTFTTGLAGDRHQSSHRNGGGHWFSFHRQHHGTLGRRQHGPCLRVVGAHHHRLSNSLVVCL